MDREKKDAAAAASEAAAAASSCVMYVACSTVMVLANKSLASSLDVRAPVALLLMQNCVATALVVCCKQAGLVRYDGFDGATALKWLPVNACFVVMLLTSFIAMRFLSVPMITVFKQLANLLTVGGELYFFGKSVSKGVVLSLATMIVGACLATNNDVDFSLAGYCWQGANCVATSAYVLYLKHATKTIPLSKFGMVFYNNFLSLPLLLFISVAAGELSEIKAAHDRGSLNAYFFAFNAFAGAVGFFLNFASVWCISATSATTYAVVGALNKIPVTVLGVLLFDATVSREMAKYIALSFAGGFMYSYEKLREMRR